MTYEEYLDGISSAQEEELTGLEEHLRDSQYQGDARRCPIHPNIKTSSDDGMFDGVCGECEYESEMSELGIDVTNPLPLAFPNQPTTIPAPIQAAIAAPSTCILPPSIEDDDVPF